MIATEERMLNVKQVRDLLGVSTSTLVRLIRDGKLPVYRYDAPLSIGQVAHDTRGLRFRSKDVEEMLHNSRIR